MYRNTLLAVLTHINGLLLHSCLGLEKFTEFQYSKTSVNKRLSYLPCESTTNYPYRQIDIGTNPCGIHSKKGMNETNSAFYAFRKIIILSPVSISEIIGIRNNLCTFVGVCFTKYILFSMSNSTKDIIKYVVWVLVCTLWITLIAILPDFLDNPVSDIRTGVTVGCYVVACSIFSFFLCYAAGINKWVSAVFLPIYGILGSVVSFCRVGYEVTITPVLVECAFNTNSEEVQGIVSWPLIVWIVFNVLLSVGLVVWRWKKVPTPKWALGHVVVALLLLTGYYFCNSRLHRSLNQRFPMNIVYSIKEYAIVWHNRQAPRSTPEFQLEASAARADSIDVVVVIGEAVRADHLQLNGYHRETNPRLMQRKNVVSLPYVRTQYTHTAASVPVLLTRADSIHPNYQYTETSFATILHQAGYYTAWITNQDMSESFATFPAECDTAIYPNAGKSVYVYSGWYDHKLLPYVDHVLSQNHPKNMLILHEIGSHWYYNNHVPEQEWYFQPVTRNRIVTHNSLEEVVNSYDNTIRYTDIVLDSLIDKLKDHRAILFYLSDHGEALGEDGHFLHAAETAPMHSCGCIVWYSDSYQKSYPEKIEALLANQHNALRTDFLYHSVLSSVGIRVMEYEADYDLFTSYPNEEK